MILPRLFQCRIRQGIVLCCSLLLSTHLFANTENIEKEIQQIDSKIAARKSSLDKQNSALQTELDEAEKAVGNSERRMDRHDKRIERAQERFSFVQASIKELDTWFNGLGVIDQGLNSSSYETRKNSLNVDLNTAQSELRNLENEKAKMDTELASSQAKVASLKSRLSNAATLVDSDRQIRELSQQRAQKLLELNKLKTAIVTKQSATPVEPVYKAYVYAISSHKGAEIEKTLKLKEWVESYGAKYIQANWNGISSKSQVGGSMIQLLGEFDEELKKIPQSSNIILIGYGMGGGAAILAATEVAQKQGRDIEYLITLDPMGIGETRMNAVYSTEAYCQAKISPEQYLNCLSAGKKRLITANVKHFYNRWQREGSLPIDAKDRMTIGKSDFPLATGKFKIESDKTKVNQMRVYYDDKNSHDLVLIDAAAELPKVLLPHLR